MTSTSPIADPGSLSGFWSARRLNKIVLIFTTVFIGASIFSDVVMNTWAPEESAASILLVVLSGTPFFLLWTRSTVAFAAFVPALVASHVFDMLATTTLLLSIMLAFVASTATLRFSLTALCTAAVWALIIPLRDLNDANTLWIIVPLIAGGWTLGQFIQQSVRRRERDLHRVAEATRRAAEAAQEERRQLARDLHDIVAHNLTIIAMQARTAEFVGTEDAARTAVRVAGDSAKEALSDLRRMLELLQAEGLVAQGADVAETDAQDGASALDLEHGAVKFGRGLESLGISTSVTTEGLDGGIPQSIRAALYRVMQEAVTNVAKHAGSGSEAALQVQGGPDAIRLAVGNSLAIAPRGRSAWMSSGNGLVGMRDRVAAFGGTFQAGREKDWWWVRAEVPLLDSATSASTSRVM